MSGTPATNAVPHTQVQEPQCLLPCHPLRTLLPKKDHRDRITWSDSHETSTDRNRATIPRIGMKDGISSLWTDSNISTLRDSNIDSRFTTPLGIKMPILLEIERWMRSCLHVTSAAESFYTGFLRRKREKAIQNDRHRRILVDTPQETHQFLSFSDHRISYREILRPCWGGRINRSVPAESHHF